VYICKSPRGLALVMFLRDGETPPTRVSFSHTPTPSTVRCRQEFPRDLLRGVAIFHQSSSYLLGGVSNDMESMGIVPASYPRCASLEGLAGRLNLS